MDALTEESYQGVHNAVIDMYDNGEFDEALKDLPEPLKNKVNKPGDGEKPLKDIFKPGDGEEPRKRNEVNNWIDRPPPDAAQHPEGMVFENTIRKKLVEEGYVPELEFKPPDDEEYLHP